MDLTGRAFKRELNLGQADFNELNELSKCP